MGQGSRDGLEGSSGGPAGAAAVSVRLTAWTGLLGTGASCTEVISSRPDQHYGVCIPSDEAPGVGSKTAQRTSTPLSESSSSRPA